MLRTRTRPSDRSGTGASTISKCFASGTPDGLDFSLTCRFTRRCTAQYLPRPSSPDCTLTLTSWLRGDTTAPGPTARHAACAAKGGSYGELEHLLESIRVCPNDSEDRRLWFCRDGS